MVWIFGSIVLSGFLSQMTNRHRPQIRKVGTRAHLGHTLLDVFSHFLDFLMLTNVKWGYQQPKSSSPSKFQVAWGYRATTKSYIGLASGHFVDLQREIH